MYIARDVVVELTSLDCTPDRCGFLDSLQEELLVSYDELP